MIQGLVLAAKASDYYGYLAAHRLKARSYPRLRYFYQLRDFHMLTAPPVLCTAEYVRDDKAKQLRDRAAARGFEVLDDLTR